MHGVIFLLLNDSNQNLKQPLSCHSCPKKIEHNIKLDKDNENLTRPRVSGDVCSGWFVSDTGFLNGHDPKHNNLRN